MKHCLWKGKFTEVVIKTYEAQGTTVMIVGPLLSLMQYFISTALRTKRQYIRGGKCYFLSCKDGFIATSCF